MKYIQLLYCSKPICSSLADQAKHVLMKSFTCKASNDIVIESKRDRNEAAVVMQINFTQLKSEINASQRINA